MELSRRDLLKAGAAALALRALPAWAQDQTELEKVVAHYKDNPAKRSAAEFLAAEAKHRAAQIFEKGTPEDQQHRIFPREVCDADVIKAGDLIANIDEAFRARDELPWAADNGIYFSDKLWEISFKGWVLPYRNGTTPLDQFPKAGIHWRTALRTKEGWQKLQECYGVKTGWDEVKSAIDVFAKSYKNSETFEEKLKVIKDVVRFWNTDLWVVKEGIAYKRSGAQEKTMEQILQDKGGRCSDLTHFAVMGLRAIGIPATTVRIPAWARFDDNHQVIGVSLPRESLLFDGMRPEPKEGESYWYSVIPAAPKVYSEQFGSWNDASRLVKDSRKDHPWFINFYLGTRSCSDVTKLHVPTVDISVDGLQPNKVTYISVLNNFCSEGLAAVAVEKTDEKGSVTFKDMGYKAGIVYFTEKDAFLAREDGKVEALRGAEKCKCVLEGLEKTVPYELHQWKDGGFVKVTTIRTGSGKTFPLDLEADRVYACRVTVQTSGTSTKTYWDRPFVVRKDGKTEKY